MDPGAKNSTTPGKYPILGGCTNGKTHLKVYPNHLEQIQFRIQKICKEIHGNPKNLMASLYFVGLDFGLAALVGQCQPAWADLDRIAFIEPARAPARLERVIATG